MNLLSKSLSKYHDDSLEEYITGERLTQSNFVVATIANLYEREVFGWFVIGGAYRIVSFKNVNKFKAFMLRHVFGIDYEQVSR